MTELRPEILDAVAIHSGIGISAMDVPSGYFYILEEAVRRAEEDVAAFNLNDEVDRTTGIVGFGVMHCSKILDELVSQEEARLASASGSYEPIRQDEFTRSSRA